MIGGAESGLVGTDYELYVGMLRRFGIVFEDDPCEDIHGQLVPEGTRQVYVGERANPDGQYGDHGYGGFHAIHYFDGTGNLIHWGIWE